MPHRQPDLSSLIKISDVQASIPPGSRLLIGVSGGADSIALLLAMARLSSRENFEVFAVHVNHQLRQESSDEEQFVKNLCKRISVPLHIVHLENADIVAGGSAEAHWRKLRYNAFTEIAQKVDASAIALGHTADDLAETFVFHLVRGTGIDGLTFQYETRHETLRIIRPLWKTQRSTIETALNAIGQTWVDDSSNLDVRHTRNFLRHRVMPLLREINPQVVTAIVRASESIASHISSDRTRICIQNVSGDRPEKLDLAPYDSAGNDHGLAADLRAFATLHETSMDNRQTAQAIQMITSSKVGTVSLPGQKTLVITQAFAWMSRQQEPGEFQLAREHSERFGGNFALLSEPVVLQPVQPGEAVSSTVKVVTLNNQTITVKLEGAPPGSMLINRNDLPPGSHRLKKLLNEARIPWYLRDYIVILTTPNRDVLLGVLSEDEILNSILARKAPFPVSIWVEEASPGA